MSGPKTTVQETTPDHIIFGPGVATINLGGDGVQRVLGMTAGGSTWNVVRTKREIVGDGLLGPTKGLIVVERVEARLTVRLKDITKEDIVLAIAGGDITGTPAGWDTITGGPIELTDYFTNVAIAAAYSTVGNDVIFLVENALPDGDFSMSLEDKSEGVIELVFLAHFTAAEPTVEPWELRFPNA